MTRWHGWMAGVVVFAVASSLASGPAEAASSPQDVLSRVVWTAFKFPMAQVHVEVVAAGRPFDDYPALPRRAAADLAWELKGPEDLHAKLDLTLNGAGAPVRATVASFDKKFFVTLGRSATPELAYLFMDSGATKGRRQKRIPRWAWRWAEGQRAAPQPMGERVRAGMKGSLLTRPSTDALRAVNEAGTAELRFDPATSLPLSLRWVAAAGTLTVEVQLSRWKQGTPVELGLPIPEAEYEEFALHDVGYLLEFLANTAPPAAAAPAGER